MPKKKLIVVIILAILFIALFFRYAHRAPKRKYCDFRVYYATSQRFAAGEDIYSRPDEAITPFKYSPMFALLVSPLSLVSQKAASLIFFTVSFISLIAVFVLSKKLIVKEPISFRQSICLYVIPAIFSSRFIFAVLDSGQVTIMIFFLVILGLYFIEKGKNILASLFLGLSVMFKYTSVLFLPYLAFKKKISAAIFSLFFIVIYCFIPALYVGFAHQIEYLKKWLPFISEHSLDKGSWYDPKNQSLCSFILRLFATDKSFIKLTFEQGLLVSFLLASAIYLLIFFKRNKSASENTIDYALLFLCAALFNPNAWLTNFVIFIFTYMVIVHYLIKIKFKDKVTLIFSLLSFIISSWVSESMVGNKLQNFFESLSTVTIATLLLVFLLLRLKFKQPLAQPN